MRTSQLIRAQDVMWLLLFSALALLSPHQDAPELETLAALGILQVIEPRVTFLATPQGAVISNLLKLAIGYVFIGLSGAVDSSYYLILLIPVLSAATTFSWLGSAAFLALASGAYLSFLYYPKEHPPLSDPEARELSVRILFLWVVGFLTNQLAAQSRKAVRRYQGLTEELETANRNLLEAEAAMRRADRLAALGQLSAGLAHELRNPLGTIRASAELLEKQLPDKTGTGAELAGFIASEVDRMNSLVTRFLDFARPLRMQRAPADVSRIVDRAIENMERHRPPFDVVFHRNYAPDVRSVECDAELMERVFYNLLLNAAQASPAGTSIAVKTRQLNGAVETSVIDRGAGIAPEHRENIFNPFFTTKSDGVGLGLAIVSKIVDEHGGHIEVESEVGQGTTFRVVLPDE